ncbi:MAG: MerR family transcriptional regulator [Conexivisphaera sp.]
MGGLYALKDAKGLLGVTTRTIQRWDKDGKIRVVRTVGDGGRRRRLVSGDGSRDTGTGTV